MRSEPGFFRRVQYWSLAFAMVGLVGCLLGWVHAPAQFFLSYLTAIITFLGIALGSLAWTMVHSLTGGKWGYVVRRFFEAAMATLPLLLLLFVPIFFALPNLFPWARPAELALNDTLRHRQSYLNPTAFTVRAIVLFGIWILIAGLLRKWSAEQDAMQSVEPTKKMRRLSGPGLVIYPITATFAFVDWVMSMEADWFSTIFPILICIGQMLSALAFSILMLALWERRTRLAEVSGPQVFHNLGNLLLALTMTWTYLAFSQLLIIWSGDLPHEISWYLHRTAGGWKAVAFFLFAFHFFLPFTALLSRRNKQRLGVLTGIAAIIFVTHVVDVWWLVTPSVFKAGVHLSWIDFAALIGVGGLWFAFFINRLQATGIVPLNDPRFALATPV
ncbi:MAG: hypothetical protein JWO45_2210 [Spartobacteria bacterium]|nr:hypothetical protein [Spartobacteria bacterium]